jgi:hypothetical protein
MYFTTSILTLALGLTGAQAMAFNKRQTGIASAQLFTDSSCQSAPVGNFDFVDDGNSCKPTNFPATVKSIRINLNGATRPRKCALETRICNILKSEQFISTTASTALPTVNLLDITSHMELSRITWGARGKRRD